MYQSAIAKLDRKTGKFEMWSTPKEWDSDAGQLGHLAVEGTPTDDKVWIKNSAGGHIYRLDLNPTGSKTSARPRIRRPESASGPTASTRTPRTMSICSFFGRQHRQDRCQDEEGDRLSDSDAGLASATRARERSRGPVVVGDNFRATPSACSIHKTERMDGVESAHAVERAV